MLRGLHSAFHLETPDRVKFIVLPLAGIHTDGQVSAMNWITALCTFLGLTACAADETISGYADPAAVYSLLSINAAPFPASATISFPEQGQARGTGPCNTWSAPQSAPYPWFELGMMRATRRACPYLDAERIYFDTLRQMTLAEVSGDVLILSNPDGQEMVFKR